LLNLLSTSLQFLTFVFQSHVCRSISKAKPPGQRTDAKRLIARLFSPELSHLQVESVDISFSRVEKSFFDLFVLSRRERKKWKKKVENH
jgi:hypothetical protein